MELNDFLSKYKELEQVLRNKEKQIGDGSVLAYENTLDQDNLEKLKTCRIIRNYCQHHSDYNKFISIDGMTNFLDKQIKEIEKQEALVKDIMIKTKAPTEKDTLADILKYMNKNSVDWVPIIRSTKPKKNESILVGVFRTEDILPLILDNKLTTKISKLLNRTATKCAMEVKIVNSKMPAKKINDKYWTIVVDDNVFKGIV